MLNALREPQRRDWTWTALLLRKLKLISLLSFWDSAIAALFGNGALQLLEGRIISAQLARVKTLRDVRSSDFALRRAWLGWLKVVSVVASTAMRAENVFQGGGTHAAH